MAKAGAFFIQLDVNWYDEWGHAVSNDAALLWVLLVGAAKRMKTDGVMTMTQVRRAAPISMSDEDLDRAIRDLLGCYIAPIGPYDRGIVLHGWEHWNDATSAKDSGTFGSHVRWHVNSGKPSPTCDFCNAIGPNSTLYSTPIATYDSPLIANDSYREEKRREEKNNLSSASDDADDTPEDDRPEVVELCDALADHVGQFLGGPTKRPKITKRWHRDMRLLVDRGPLGREQPESFEPQRIQRCMEILFTKMAEPGHNGFCWAAQVRSPHALREHWDQISSAWQRMSKDDSSNDYWIDAFGNKVYQ